jgi:O-antigen ligase
LAGADLPGLISVVLVGVILASFLGGLRTGVTALLLIRPLCDRLFEAARFEVAGRDLSCGAILNVLVISIMILNIPRINNRMPVALERAWLPFLLLSFAAVFYSPVALDGFRKFLTYVSYMSMFVLPFAMAKKERDILYLTKIVILSSVAPVLYGLFQLGTGIDWYQGSRIESSFTHPNIFAFYLLTTIGLILSLLLASGVALTGRMRSLLMLYLVPLLAMLVATKTRSAWLGCMILFVVYGLIADKRILALTLILPVFALAIPSVRDRLTDLAAGNEYVGWVQNVNAYAWRKILWEKAFAFIMQKPLFGYGLYSFPYYSPTFFPLETERGVDAHNVYIQLLFETGLAGLAAYLWIFCRKLVWLFRCWSLDKRRMAMIATITAVYLMTAYSDNLLEYVSYGWCYWFALGLVFSDLSRYRVARRHASEPASYELPAGMTAHVRGS